MNIPLPIVAVDLKSDYQRFKKEIDRAIQNVLESGWFILGPQTAIFEKAFGHYIGTDYAFGVASGTDALELSLRACGIGKGDIVFTVSNTAVATIAAIELTGAVPVFVDIDPETYTMSPESLQYAIQKYKGAKAIIPVHLYGHPADMPIIMELAARHDLLVIEDCAQSHGASIAGKKSGCWGDAAGFSFYPTKNLGGFGDGGMLVTNNEQLAEEILLFRQYGWRDRYVSIRKGMNTRLDEIQAAILHIKLKYLEEMNDRRRNIAATYRRGLKDTDVVLPLERDNAHHVYHQFVIRTRNRDKLLQFLHENQVDAQIHYPLPIHQQPAYIKKAILSSTLTNTEELVGETLSLPISPHMSSEQVDYVVSKTRIGVTQCK